MRGLVLVSERDRLLHVSADGELWRHWSERVAAFSQEEGPHSPSTSSGVSSDHDDDDEPEFDASSRPSMSEIGLLLLPMVALYRSSSVMSHDEYERFCSATGRLVFRRLAGGFLLISICESALKTSEEERRIAELRASIDVHLGPLFPLFGSSLVTVNSGTKYVEEDASRLCRSNFRTTRSSLDIRRCALEFPYSARNLAQLKTVCTQMQLHIGNNRCLLMCGEDLLASAHSAINGSELWRCLSALDLNLLFRRLSQNAAKFNNGFKPTLTQAWLRPTSGAEQHYVDVMEFPLNSSYRLVCLVEARGNTTLRSVIRLCNLIENLQYCEEGLHDEMARIEAALTAAKALIREMPTDLAEKVELNSYLRSPERTAGFFQNLWDRIAAELKRMEEAEVEEIRPKPKPLSRIRSLSMFRSSLSLRSTSSGSLATLNSLKHAVPPKLESLLQYTTRQLRGLIQELCSCANVEANTNRLPLFVSTMQRIFRLPQVASLREIPIGIKERDAQVKNFTKPSELRLDMLAYSFESTAFASSFEYIPDENVAVSEQFIEVFDRHKFDSECGAFIHVQNAEEYLLIQVRTRLEATAQEKIPFYRRLTVGSVPAKRQKEPEELPAGITCRVLYPKIVNQCLALRQLKVLASVLDAKLRSTVRLLL